MDAEKIVRQILWAFGVIAALYVLLMLFGCATSKQSASYPVLGTNGVVVGFGTASSTVYAIGDAKQVIDKVRASSGKTASVGASGIDQQATIADLIRALAEFANAIKTP